MAKKYESLDITFMDAKEIAAELLRIAEIDPDACVQGDEGQGAYIYWSREMTEEEEREEAQRIADFEKRARSWDSVFWNTWLDQRKANDQTAPQNEV